MKDPAEHFKRLHELALAGDSVAFDRELAVGQADLVRSWTRTRRWSYPLVIFAAMVFLYAARFDPLPMAVPICAAMTFVIYLTGRSTYKAEANVADIRAKLAETQTRISEGLGG